MACNITTIQTEACTSGIGKVQDPIVLLQLIAQLTCEAAEAVIASNPSLPLTSVQFNDGGVFGGDADFTWNKTTNALSVTGSVVTPLVVGGSSTTSDLFLKTTSGVGAAGADMHFLVGNNGATEAMTILNNGNVGIGTTTPEAKLEVDLGSVADSVTETAYFVGSTWVGTPDAIVKIREGFYNEATIGALELRHTYTGAAVIGPTRTQDYSTLTLQTNSTPRITIMGTTGKVGIGTTTPGAKLEVAGDVKVAGGAQLLATTAALTNGAAASLGTLANAPAVGNPTKWIAIDDAGVVRYIPAW